MKMADYDYDVLVIGAGPGGYVAAHRDILAQILNRKAGAGA